MFFVGEKEGKVMMAVCIVCLLEVSRRSVRSGQDNRPDLEEGNLFCLSCWIESECWMEIAA